MTLPDVVDFGPPPVIAPTADGFAFAANTCDQLDAAFRPTDAQAVHFQAMSQLEPWSEEIIS